MAGRKLATTVIVPAPPLDGGEAFRVFGPDDDVPDWAEQQIGDHAWEQAETKQPAKAAPPKSEK